METSPEIPPSVNIEKLQRLTNKCSKKSPTNFLNFSQFASENFGQHLNFTAGPVPSHSSSGRTSKKISAKALYNEVQRNAVYFGITGAEMKAFYEMKTQKSESGREPTVNIQPSVQSTPKQATSHQEVPPDLRPSNTITATPAKASTIKRSDTPQSITDEEIITDIPKTSTQRVNSDVSGYQSFNGTPEDKEPLLFTPKKRNDSPISISSRTSITDLRGQDSSPGQRLLRRASTRSLKNLYNRSSRLMRLNSSTSSASLHRTPSKRECHSVEDTLLADEDFKDFSVPRTGSPYYPSSILDSPSSSRSSSARPSTTHQLGEGSVGLGEFTKPITPVISRRSRSMTFSSPTVYNSPLGQSRRSVSGPLDRVDLTPIPFNLTINDKPAINIITEEEILDDYSRF